MKNNIQLLKEGQEGYGLLIESDAGYTSGFSKPINLNETTLIDKGNNRIYIDCILQKANVQNRNGRIYPLPILQREDAKYQQLIQSNNAFGECNHPDTPTISLKETDLSHLIKKTWWEAETLWGTLEIITSKKYHDDGTICCIGDHIANLLERGYKLGISSRGLGSVKKVNGKTMVQNDFELIGFDLVSSPSTPDAYLYQQIKKINENYEITNISKIQNKITKFLSKK